MIGHAVDGGSTAQQRRLGLRRAHRIREALTRFGIDGSDIVVRSAGADEPIAANDTAAGRAQNRRVEIRTIPSDLGTPDRGVRNRVVRVHYTGQSRRYATR